MKKVSAKDIQELIKGERNVPLIIDFYATWCGPCILMAQELEMVGLDFIRQCLKLFLVTATDAIISSKLGLLE